MSEKTSFAMNAYILCGGASKRMGESKCNVQYGSVSYVQRIGQVLAPHFSTIYAVGKEGQEINTSFQVLRDSEKKHHPLWGVVAAMSHSNSPFVFIVACDLIFLSAKGIESLLGANAPCYAISSNGQQPLLGVYPIKWLRHTITCAENNQSVFNWAKDTRRIQVENQNLLNVNYPWERP